jgi:hypothetical protein
MPDQGNLIYFAKVKLDLHLIEEGLVAPGNLASVVDKRFLFSGVSVDGTS